VLLFVIALVWRMRVTMKADNLKADHGTPSAAAALTGAAGRRQLSRRERNKRSVEERVSQPHIHPNYRNVDAGGSHRPALEEPNGSRRAAAAFDPSAAAVREPSRRAAAFDPSAAAVREPSRRTAATLDPPLPASVRKTSRRTAAAVQQGAAVHQPRRDRGQERKRSDRGPERKRSDESERGQERSERRRERERSDRSDRGQERSERRRERSARKNEPVRVHSSRRNKAAVPIILYE
jgi:hypothetical protein